MSVGRLRGKKTLNKSGLWTLMDVFNDYPGNYSPIQATGGDTVTDVRIDGRLYRVHEFTTVGTTTFDVSSLGSRQDLDIDFLVIGGGGGGGTTGGDGNLAEGGGGGAGGYRTSMTGEQSGGLSSPEPKIVAAVQSYTVTVGAGGGQNANGQDSVFGSITSLGGGRGSAGGQGYPSRGADGGSGGGGGGHPTGTYGNFSINNEGAGTAGQGGNGWEGYMSSNSKNWYAGGGGGAGELGGNLTTAGQHRSSGSNGLESSITGTPVMRGGGGGAVSNIGGQGGGGAGGPVNGAGVSGTANTGGGGGGKHNSYGSSAGSAGSGGSGVVIVRYPVEPAA